jgi:hypothetical protein
MTNPKLTVEAIRALWNDVIQAELECDCVECKAIVAAPSHIAFLLAEWQAERDAKHAKNIELDDMEEQLAAANKRIAELEALHGLTTNELLHRMNTSLEGISEWVYRISQKI